jgi:transcriptional regulator GlxA family with amidase domain
MVRLLRYAMPFARVGFTTATPVVTAVRDRLHAAFAEPPTLAQLARVASRSPYHLIRAFRREVGLSPFAYYDQLRVAKAKEMLACGTKPFEVTRRLGFCDQSHFTRTFRRSALVPPGRWSTMLKGSQDGIEKANPS